jgi:hypothetical protein
MVERGNNNGHLGRVETESLVESDTDRAAWTIFAGGSKGSSIFTLQDNFRSKFYTKLNLP